MSARAAGIPSLVLGVVAHPDHQPIPLVAVFLSPASPLTTPSVQLSHRSHRPKRTAPHSSAPSSAATSKILTPEALRFLAVLHRTFDGKRRELLKARDDVQKRLDAVSVGNLGTCFWFAGFWGGVSTWFLVGWFLVGVFSVLVSLWVSVCVPISGLYLGSGVRWADPVGNTVLPRVFSHPNQRWVIVRCEDVSHPQDDPLRPTPISFPLSSHTSHLEDVLCVLLGMGLVFDQVSFFSHIRLIYQRDGGSPQRLRTPV